MESLYENISHLNLNLDIHNFSLANVFFLDTKRNIIMDGNFTKIIYSNHFFSMNSIYLYFPVEINNIEQVLNKKFIKFNPCSANNINLIQDISKIETRILDYYKMYNNINMRNSNLLSKQLHSGNIKVYQEFSYSQNSPKVYNGAPVHNDRRLLTRDSSATLPFLRTKQITDSEKEEVITSPNDDGCKREFVIKISGVWENYEEIGLTYKIIEQCVFRR